MTFHPWWVCLHLGLYNAPVCLRTALLPVSGNLKGEGGAAERTVEDVFIRRFMFGTFHGCLVNELVIKRRGNLLVVCALMLQRLQPHKFYFLIGYTESLLSHLYKCPVKLEVQTVKDKAVYKYLWWNCVVLMLRVSARDCIPPVGLCSCIRCRICSCLHSCSRWCHLPISVPPKWTLSVFKGFRSLCTNSQNSRK